MKLFYSSKDMKPRPGTTYVVKSNVPYRKDPPKITATFDKNLQSHKVIEKTVEDNNSNCVGDQAEAPRVSSSVSLNSRNTVNEHAQNNLNKDFLMPNLEKKLSQAVISPESQGNILKTQSNAFKKGSSSAPSLSTLGTPETKYAPCFYPRKPKIKPKSFLESAQPNVYAPQFFPKKKVLNSASKVQTKPIQDSSVFCKIQTTSTKTKSTGQSRKDPVQVNSILSNFNVKKKIPEEKKSVKAAKGAASKRKRMPVTSSSDEKKVNLIKKAKA